VAVGAPAQHRIIVRQIHPLDALSIAESILAHLDVHVLQGTVNRRHPLHVARRRSSPLRDFGRPALMRAPEEEGVAELLDHLG
jgi:hypothetical protein